MIRRSLAYLGAIALASTIAVVGAPAAAHADEIRDSQWYLETLGINDAHELSQGEGVTIGVIDSGIDATHPDLENNVKPGKDYGDSKDDGLHDPEGHGTSIASILAGHGHGDNNDSGVLGIAPKAEVVSVATHCRNQDCGRQRPGDWLADGIKWLVDEGVDIISLSTSAENDSPDAVEYATEHNVPVVAAAGNTDTDYGEFLGEQEDTMTDWPARAPGAIPVTGTTQDGDFWEGGIDLRAAAQQPQFGISAPATDLPGAMPGGEYATNSGTSGSAPIVAGTLALIKSAYPDLSYDQWLDRMLDTVEDKGDEGFDDKYGWGTVNTLKALTEETTYSDSSGDHVSSPEDRLPLEEQGKDTGDGGTDDGSDEDAADGNPIAAATGGMPAWLIITLIAGLLIVTAAIITAVVLTQRRKKRHTGNNPPSGGIPGPGNPPAGSPPPGPPGPPGPGLPGGPPVDSAPGNPTTHHSPHTPTAPPTQQASPPGAPPAGPNTPGQAQAPPPQTNPPGNNQSDPDTPFTPPQ